LKLKRALNFVKY